MSHQTNVTREMVEWAVRAQIRAAMIAAELPSNTGAAFQVWEQQTHEAGLIAASAMGDIVFMLAREMGIDTAAVGPTLERLRRNAGDLSAFIKRAEGLVDDP